MLEIFKNKSSVKIFDDNYLLKNKKNKKFFIKKNVILKSKFDYIILSPGIDLKKCNLKKYLKKNRKKIITELDVFQNFIQIIQKLLSQGPMVNLLHARYSMIFLDQKIRC